MAVVQLDPQLRHDLGPNGLQGLVWPISPKAHHSARNGMVEALQAAIREAKRAQIPFADALWILIHHLSLDALEVYNALAIIDRWKVAGYQLNPPNRSRALRALASGHEPPAPTIVNILERCNLAPSRLRAPARLVRDLWLSGDMRRRRLRPIDWDREIVSVTVAPLALANAATCGERVTYRRPAHWFSRQEAPVTHQLQALDLAMDALRLGFERGHVKLTETATSYFARWLPRAMSLVEAHRRNLRAKTPLPRRLWTPTGGDIWSRILRHEVYIDDGEVIGHDHGSGSGAFSSEINDYRALTEFEGVSQFFTFAAGQAQGLRNTTHPEAVVQCRLPEIKSLTDNPRLDIIRDRPTYILPKVVDKRTEQRKNRKSKRILVLSSYYFGERLNHQASLSDLTTVDFEARLLSRLVRKGHEVLYKPHPLIVTRSPKDMAERMGAIELSGPSESALEHADIVITFDQMSTAFATSLLSGISMISIDFGLYPMQQEAQNLLDNRAVTLRGHVDNEGRCRINWPELAEAIETCQSLEDEAFEQQFYSRSLHFGAKA